MKNNLCARNPSIYYAEVLLALYRDDLLPESGGGIKFYREDKPMEDSINNKRSNPKV